MMVYAILLREIDGLCVMIVHVQELKQMSNQEVEDKLLQCSSIVVLATAGLFERTTKSVSVRKYLKLEQHGEGAENHPLIKQIYNLPRLLCLFKKDSKPIIALSLSGVTAPPRPAPTSLAMLESSYSASVVTSYNEVLKALADAKIPPSAPLDVTTRRSGQGAVSRNDESNLALMEKIKQLETEARGLKAENHRLLSVIAPIGMSQSSSTKRSLVNQGDLSASAPSLTRPETCDKGISIEGLRKLKEIATRLCVEGRFAEDRHFDIFYPGTTDYSKLTTTQFVSMWVKDKTVTGSRRLADCPEIIDEKFIGPPSVFVSHPWRGSLASLLEIIFDYARDKKLPPETKFWLDMVAINQHKDTIEERRVNQADVLAFKDVVKVCEGGTLVFLCDIPDDEGKSSTDNTHVSTTASRGWCLYEWDWTLALHKDTKKINFRGMMDTQETLAALGKFDVGSSICWSPLDKRRILEDMMNHHGSKVAFNEKLQRHLRENVVKEDCGVGKKYVESAQKGISIRGLRKFEALLRAECAKGTFLSFPMWGETRSVSSFDDLKTADVVYGWLRSDSKADGGVTRGKRLADCPQFIDPSDIGLPQYMVSHAWGGCIKKVFETVYSFFSDASEEDTRIFFDLVGVDDFDNFSVDQIVPVCDKGTIVVADMANVNPAKRILVLKDWLMTLKEHGRGALHLEGLSLEDRETLATSIDSQNADAKKPEDKARVLQEINDYIGSLKAFDDKLRLQTIIKPLPYNVLHADKDTLIRRADRDGSPSVDLTQYNTWLAFPPGASGYKQALCIISGPCTGKSTFSAKICDSHVTMLPQQVGGGGGVGGVGGVEGQAPQDPQATKRPSAFARSQTFFQRGAPATGGYEERCLAFHFLKSGDANSLDPLVIVKSIAAQLSPRIPKLAEHLLSLSPKRVDALTDIEEAIETLLSPIFSYEGELLIVVDGLDEADSTILGAENRVVDMLRSLVPRVSRSTRFVVSTRSEPSYSHGLDVKLVIRGVFNGSVDFFDPQPRYGSCLTYNTVVNEAHLVDVLPSLKDSASVEDLYKAYAAVFDRQPPRGQRMVDLVSILAASRRYLSVRMLEEMDYRRHDLEELPGWGCLFYSSNGRILTDRLLNSWLQSKPAKEYGVDVNRGHALLGMKLLREMNEAQRSGNSVVVPSKYARDFALYHQCQALSAGGLDQGVLLKQLAGAVIESIAQ